MNLRGPDENLAKLLARLPEVEYARSRAGGRPRRSSAVPVSAGPSQRGASRSASCHDVWTDPHGAPTR